MEKLWESWHGAVVCSDRKKAKVPLPVSHGSSNMHSKIQDFLPTPRKGYGDENGLTGLLLRCQHDCTSFFKVKSVFLVFSASESSNVPCLVALFFHLQSQLHGLTFICLPRSHLPQTFLCCHLLPF